MMTVQVERRTLEHYMGGRSLTGELGQVIPTEGMAVQVAETDSCGLLMTDQLH